MPRQLDALTPQQIGTAEALKAAREASGLRQGEFSARVNVHQATVNDWELGRRCPPLWRLPAIADALKMKPSKLAALIAKTVREYES